MACTFSLYDLSLCYHFAAAEKLRTKEISDVIILANEVFEVLGKRGKDGRRMKEGNEGTNEGTDELRVIGRKERPKEGREGGGKEGRKKGRKEGRRGGGGREGREGGRDGGREGGREGGKKKWKADKEWRHTRYKEETKEPARDVASKSNHSRHKHPVRARSQAEAPESDSLTLKRRS